MRTCRAVIISFFMFGYLSSLFSDEEFLVLITGCGRSGTKYMATLMQRSGLDLQHEEPGRNGSIAWPMAVDAFYSPWGECFKQHKFKHVFHQVRNPLDTISSWYFNTMTTSSWNYIYDHIPEILPEEPTFVQCAKYWLYWNIEAEKKAEWRFRIEDIEVVFDEIGKRLGVNLNREALNQVKKNTNTRKDILFKITWKDLNEALSPEVFQSIQALAKKYGYSTIDEEE